MVKSNLIIKLFFLIYLIKSAVLSAIDTFDFSRPSVWLDQLGRVLGTMGGTSGGIYSLFLTAASGAFNVNFIKSFK